MLNNFFFHMRRKLCKQWNIDVALQFVLTINLAKQCFVCLRNINLLHASHFQFIFCHCSAFVWQGRIFPIYFIISQNCFLHLCCIAHLYLCLWLYFANLYITILQQFHYECSSTMANLDKGWWYKFCIFVIFLFSI